jgi:hypothetical protein
MLLLALCATERCQATSIRQLLLLMQGSAYPLDGPPVSLAPAHLGLDGLLPGKWMPTSRLSILVREQQRKGCARLYAQEVCGLCADWPSQRYLRVLRPHTLSCVGFHLVLTSAPPLSELAVLSAASHLLTCHPASQLSDPVACGQCPPIYRLHLQHCHSGHMYMHW